MQPGVEVADMDRQIFELVNKARSNPQEFISHLQSMESRFEGFLMKQPGKTTLRTKEGV